MSRKDPIPPRPNVWGRMNWQHYVVAAIGISFVVAVFAIVLAVLSA